MKNKTKNIVIIGNGIAAWCLAYYLKDHEITLIDANDHTAPCSYHTTAINCLRGTQKGLSPLGDLIFESMQEFEQFYQANDPDGIDSGIEYQIWDELTHAKWQRRYPDNNLVENEQFLKTKLKSQKFFYANPAYFIAPKKLQNWFLSQSRVKIMQDYILEIEPGYKLRGINHLYSADIVIICANHNTRYLAKNSKSEFIYYLNHSKTVVGDYLELKKASSFNLQFKESFNLAVGSDHFIYRKKEDILHIGSTTVNNCARELADISELKQIYDRVKSEISLTIPSFDNFKPICGIRHKGHKRLPFWGKIDNDNLYSVCGLYKNAFSFSFLAAKQLRDQIN